MTVDGHRLALRRRGRGRPVLLLHGIPTSSLLWRHVQPRLAERADTIAVDLLGYGESAKPAEPAPTLPVQAGLLHTLLEQWDLTDVLVVGHDIGGGVAQLLAVRAPDRVTGLVLVDTVAYDSFPEPTIARLRDPGWDDRIQSIDLAAGLRKSLVKGLGDPAAATPELAAMYAAPFEGREGRAAYLRAARALRTEDLSTVMDEVERLKCRVLVVWGEDDPFQPIRYGERLAAALPNATLVTVAGARHFLPEDRGEELARLILDWSRL
ncbi:alpha/beta fold hydrolase [Actinomadura rubrobrunea]|uniref:alpha/beta fold hydrolase n=1 Tax=Actinomadura rubrobrunea TaxID=115335 RepID=UPI000829F92B|nr:alpha/beta fold hydrolase [Actinomadura rubrobrunea]